MPLRLELKPNERLIINGALIRNGSRRTSFLVETQCKFLRESEIIRETDADTPAKQLCVTLQAIYLSDDISSLLGLFLTQASNLMRAAPSMTHYILAIQTELEAQRYHAAIKRCRELIAYEGDILCRQGKKGDERRIDAK